MRKVKTIERIGNVNRVGSYGTGLAMCWFFPTDENGQLQTIMGLPYGPFYSEMRLVPFGSCLIRTRAGETIPEYKVLFPNVNGKVIFPPNYNPELCPKTRIIEELRSKILRGYALQT